MTKEQQIIVWCEQRNELDFLFTLTSIVAKSDSVGEGYFGYAETYDREDFDGEVDMIKIKGDSLDNGYHHLANYTYHAGVWLYKAYLSKLDIISLFD